MKIYVSHSIRGKFGNNATHQQQVVNVQKAIKFGNWLKQNFPEVKFYVPCKLDLLLHNAGINPIDIVNELLTLDCAIIKGCDGVLVYSPDNYISGGMKIEIDFTDKNNIPTFFELSAYLYSTDDLPTEDGRQKIMKFIEELENGS